MLVVEPARAEGSGDRAIAIGVLSDTHGRIHPSVLRALRGVIHIIHAGDVGKRSVLRRLQEIAPVTAVSGNTDTGKLAQELPQQAEGDAGGIRFLVAHKPKQLRKLLRRGAPVGIDLIVTGHLHEPSMAWEEGALHINPGTASAPEEGDPVPTVAIVTGVAGALSVTFIPVAPDPGRSREVAGRSAHATAQAEDGGGDGAGTDPAGGGPRNR